MIIKTFLFQAIQFSKTVLIQTIQFSISIVFVYPQLNDKTVLFQKTQFSISTQFTSIWPIDIRCNRSWPEGTWERRQWRGTRHSTKPQHYWNLPIRLFRVINRTLVEEDSYSDAEKQSVYFTAPANWASIK